MERNSFYNQKKFQKYHRKCVQNYESAGATLFWQGLTQGDDRQVKEKEQSPTLLSLSNGYTSALPTLISLLLKPLPVRPSIHTELPWTAPYCLPRLSTVKWVRCQSLCFLKHKSQTLYMILETLCTWLRLTKWQHFLPPEWSWCVQKAGRAHHQFLFKEILLLFLITLLATYRHFRWVVS